MLASLSNQPFSCRPRGLHGSAVCSEGDASHRGLCRTMVKLRPHDGHPERLTGMTA